MINGGNANSSFTLILDGGQADLINKGSIFGGFSNSSFINIVDPVINGGQSNSSYNYIAKGGHANSEYNGQIFGGYADTIYYLEIKDIASFSEASSIEEV